MKKALVTGANGHLGNNLVRLLHQEGYRVRAGVRNTSDTRPFEGLPGVEVVHFDLLNKSSIAKALEGMDVVFQVAAVFKFWSAKPQEEIYLPNVQGTKNVIEACIAQKIKKVVYISSVASLNYSKVPISTALGFNPDRSKPYYNSKNDSEQLALQLAKAHELDLVSMLPSAIIGRECYKMTDSNNLLKLVMEGKIFIDTNFYTNFIDVQDVAKGCLLAAEKGEKWKRYILANEKSLGFPELISLANELYPELALKIPGKAPKWLLNTNALLMEALSKVTGKAPLLQCSDVKMYYQLRQDFDISDSVQDLGFRPKGGRQAVSAAMQYMKEKNMQFS